MQQGGQTDATTGNPASLIVPQFGSSKITVFLWGTILGDPGADSRDDAMFVVKVYFKIETRSL